MYCMKVRLVNCVPLSVMTLLGTPKRQTSPLKNLTVDYAITFLTGSTSGHFVNLSIATYKYSKPLTAWGKGPNMSSPRPKMARREELFEGLELVDEASSNGTDTLHTWLLVPSHPGGRWARRNLAGTPFRKGPRPYVGATYASIYLYQQLQSFLPGDALQFHTVRPSPIQDVSTNWYRADRRATFSASSCYSGSSPVWRNQTVCCAHAVAWGSTTRTKGISSAMGAAVSTARA